MVDVGVVMPVYYQRIEYLQQSIHSILAQSYKSYRLIIVIDGAPEMLQHVERFVSGDPRVEILNNATNLGVAGALNAGFSKLWSKPEIRYLTWVSSDNLYDEEFLDTLRRGLRQSSDETGLVYSSFRSIDGAGNQLKSEAELSLLRQFQAQPIEELLNTCTIGVSFMYKTRFALQVEGYRYPPVEDYDFWLRLTEKCGVRYIPVELMDYRVDSEFSVSSKLQTVDAHRKWRYVYHLTRLEARIRRGIPVETSILFLARNSGDSTIAQIDKLYEQIYSNYRVYLFDLTPDGSAGTEIAKLPHTSILFKWFPNSPEQEVLYYAAQFLDTPFAFVYGSDGFQINLELYYLAAELKKAPDDTYSVCHSPDKTQVVPRRDLYSEIPLGNELFRTKKLVQWLIYRHADFPGGAGK